jgi:GNAT superfamily N-acetyltransferase
MTRAYEPPRLLLPADELGRFACRSSEQTTWLRRHARQSAASGTTRIFVVTLVGEPEVVAYYAWCMAHLAADAPERVRRGAGRYPQPVALLARLGVHRDHEGRGLGAGLFADAVRRLVGLGDEIGCRGLLIHAETEEARDFYLHLVPELMPSPTDDLHLLLLMKDARRTALG